MHNTHAHTHANKITYAYYVVWKKEANLFNIFALFVFEKIKLFYFEPCSDPRFNCFQCQWLTDGLIGLLYALFVLSNQNKPKAYFLLVACIYCLFISFKLII